MDIRPHIQNLHLHVENLHVHLPDGSTALDLLTGLDKKVDQVLSKQEKILMNEADFKLILDKIDATTTKQGEILAQEGDTLQEISDDTDRLVAALAQVPGISPELAAQAQGIADRAQLVSDALDRQAAFSKLIAAKSEPVPVVPVPDPSTPPPDVP